MDAATLFAPLPRLLAHLAVLLLALLLPEPLHGLLLQLPAPLRHHLLLALQAVAV